MFIHYGSSEFKKEYFQPIKNWCKFNKPYGGLWASPVEPKYIDWKTWCEENEFGLNSLKQSFTFKLKPTADIFEVFSKKDIWLLEDMLELNNTPMLYNFIDYEKLISYGYDGLFVQLTYEEMFNSRFYGFDCDSLLIFNPDCIVMSEDNE